MIDDARYVWRRIRSRPGIALLAASMLALGIGLSTAMFTVVDALLLRPVPFPAADRLARVGMQSQTGGSMGVSPAVLDAWRGSPAFADVAGTSPTTVLLGTSPDLTTRSAAYVSTDLFDMLGVRAIRGRTFLSGEGRAGADAGVLISEDVWRTSLGSAPNVVGSHVVVDGSPRVVAGVMPASFRFPAWDTTVWLPLDFQAPPPDLAQQRPLAFVRFSASIPRADALRLATEEAHAADASTSQLFARPYPLAGVVLGDYAKAAVPMLGGGVVLVFLVLCANVSSLLLAQMTRRRHEYGLCSALGASRSRLLRQAFLEHVVLGAVGAVGGLGLAWLLVIAAYDYLPAAFLVRSLNPIGLDMRAVLMTTAAGLVAIVAAGWLPAWLGTRLDAVDSMRVTERGGTETRGARRATRLLLVSEVALACVLLVGATLLVRTFANLSSVDRGLNAQGVLTAWASLPGDVFADRDARLAAADVLEQSLRALPGVRAVAWSYGVPPNGGGNHHFTDWRGDDPGAPAIDLSGGVNSFNVSGDFFDLYGIPLLAGRSFAPGDGGHTVIVGERLAGVVWPGQNPVGRSFSFGQESYQVVGLVSEITVPSLEAGVDMPEFYLPFEPGGRQLHVNLRCDAACPSVALIRERLLSAVVGVEVHHVGPVEDAFAEQLARPRASAAAAFVFAGIAVLAAAGGLFSVQSYTVGRRRREFGIRTALGASPGEIRRMVLRDGLMVAAVGIAFGVAGAWALGRAVASLQYGVTLVDPLNWAFVIGMLAAATVGASWLPARQASRVEPLLLLRDE